MLAFSTGIVVFLPFFRVTLNSQYSINSSLKQYSESAQNEDEVPLRTPSKMALSMLINEFLNRSSRLLIERTVGMIDVPYSILMFFVAQTDFTRSAELGTELNSQ